MDYVTARTFAAAAESGSFAAAAARVNASASTVTARIAQLESRLGTRLFDRGKQGCRPTRAGERFLPHANAMIRAWEAGREEAGLPERFTANIAIGGQYALWSRFLIQWLPEFCAEHPALALRAMVGAPARLNRELVDGTLDIALLYDPVLRSDVGVEPLFDDRLVMVSGNPERDWHENYVRIRWGAGVSAAIIARLGEEPGPGLSLDLGAQAGAYLVNQRAAGYMPLRLVWRELQDGKLSRVPDTPDFEYPAFIAWRRDAESETLAAIRHSLGRTARAEEAALGL